MNQLTIVDLDFCESQVLSPNEVKGAGGKTYTSSREGSSSVGPIKVSYAVEYAVGYQFDKKGISTASGIGVAFAVSDGEVSTDANAGVKFG